MLFPSTTEILYLYDLLNIITKENFKTVLWQEPPQNINLSFKMLCLILDMWKFFEGI